MSVSNVITDHNSNYNVTISKNSNVTLMSDILFGSPPFPEPLQVLLPHLKYPFLICLQFPTPYSRPGSRTASAGETSQIPQPDGAGPLSPTYYSDTRLSS